jgi:hypothetical protein
MVMTTNGIPDWKVLGDWLDVPVKPHQVLMKTWLQLHDLQTQRVRIAI